MNSLSPARKAYLLSVRRQKRQVRLWQIALLAGLLLLWELSCRLGLSDGFLISSPSRMATTFLSLCRSGDLWRHIGVSCGETVVGFLSGTALGTAVAICMWWSEKLAKILDPYLVVLNALPKTALGPIFIVWMGAAGVFCRWCATPYVFLCGRAISTIMTSPCTSPTGLLRALCTGRHC